MNFNELIQIIKEKSMSVNNSDISSQIDLIIQSGSTGSEITVMIGKFLLNLNSEQPDTYRLLEKEINMYLKLCRSIGLPIS